MPLAARTPREATRTLLLQLLRKRLFLSRECIPFFFSGLPSMQELKFPVSSTPGRIVGEGDGRLLNAYATKLGDQIYIRRSPGLTTSGGYATGHSTPRGILVSSFSALLIAYNGAVTNGAVPLSGSIAGTDGVTWAENTNGNIVAVREGGGAYTLIGSAVAAYSGQDADLPSTVNSVTFGNGYFFFSQPNGTIWATNLNTYAVDPLSFATAESRRDQLMRVMWHSGVLYAFGLATIEPWLDVGGEP